MMIYAIILSLLEVITATSPPGVIPPPDFVAEKWYPQDLATIHPPWRDAHGNILFPLPPPTDAIQAATTPFITETIRFPSISPFIDNFQTTTIMPRISSKFELTTRKDTEKQFLTGIKRQENSISTIFSSKSESSFSSSSTTQRFVSMTPSSLFTSSSATLFSSNTSRTFLFEDISSRTTPSMAIKLFGADKAIQSTIGTTLSSSNEPTPRTTVLKMNSTIEPTTAQLVQSVAETALTPSLAPPTLFTPSMPESTEISISSEDLESDFTTLPNETFQDVSMSTESTESSSLSISLTRLPTTDIVEKSSINKDTSTNEFETIVFSNPIEIATNGATRLKLRNSNIKIEGRASNTKILNVKIESFTAPLSSATAQPTTTFRLSELPTKPELNGIEKENKLNTNRTVLDFDLDETETSSEKHSARSRRFTSTIKDVSFELDNVIKTDHAGGFGSEISLNTLSHIPFTITTSKPITTTLQNIKKKQNVPMFNQASSSIPNTKLSDKVGLQNNPLKECVDLLFVLDSGGVNASVFEKQKQVIQTLTNRLKLGEDRRVALLLYSSQIRRRLVVVFDNKLNATSFSRKLKEIPFLGGITATGEALKMAQKIIEKRSSPTVVVLLTDGFSFDHPENVAESIRKKSNSSILVSGIFTIVVKNVLNNIAGGEENVFMGEAGVQRLAKLLNC